MTLSKNKMAKLRPFKPCHPAFSRGFTLIEVVIAISLLAVILGIVYSALNQMLRTKQIIEQRAESQRIANSVLSRLTRELQLAFTGQGLLPKRDEDPNKRNPNNFSLSAETQTFDNLRRGDSITFVALEGGQYLPDGGQHSGLVQITYRVEPNPELKSEQDPNYLLIRDETPLIRPVERAYKKTMIFPITDRVYSLQFRYFDRDKQEWSDSWGVDERLGLPAKVEFRLVLRSEQGQMQEYSSMLALGARN